MRGKLSTELPVASDPRSGGISFEAPGLGGVTWGAVTGIDASGSRAQGSLRLDGDRLELALPGEFVDRAAFPLLLDPLIGATITVIGGAANDYAPDVSFDATHACYLVVWHRRYSSTNRAVFGQRVTGTGWLVGSVLGLSVTNGNFRSPSVANVNASDRFLVVYETDATVGAAYQCRAVNASDGAISLFLNLGTTSMAGGLDVAGDSRDQGDMALVVFKYFNPSFLWTIDGLMVQQLQVPPSPGTPALVGQSAYVGNVVNAPRITRHGGSIARYLVVWETGSATNRYVYGAVVTNGPVASPPHAIVATSVDFAAPDCATKDGTEFAITYERRAGGPSGDSDVACRTVTYVPPTNPFLNGTWTVGTERIVAGGGTWHQVSPAIDFADAKYIVTCAAGAWLGGAWNLYMMGLDPNSCLPCATVTAIDSSSATADHYPKIAAKYSASPTTNDEAMVVWESTDTQSDVNAQQVEAIGPGGAVTSIGPGCGNGGTAGVSGAFAVGNPQFAFTLDGADPSAFLAALALAVPGAPLVCGPCSLTVGLVYVQAPITAGSATLPLAVPCEVSLVGAKLEVQWVTIGGAASPCALLPSLSGNRLSAEVGE